MGTRSVIQIFNGKKPFVSIYNMFDGYMGNSDCIGSTISKLLSRKNVNGILLGQELKVYNGAGNFATLLMFELGRVNFDPKSNEFEAGMSYLTYPDTDPVDTAEYVYKIKFSSKDETKSPKVKVSSYDYNSGWLTTDEFINLNDRVGKGEINI